MQTVTDATQKETTIGQQQHRFETLKCKRNQTMLRLLSSAANASTQWRVRELYCPTTYIYNIGQMIQCLWRITGRSEVYHVLKCYSFAM